jgi:hypothetical protein
VLPASHNVVTPLTRQKWSVWPAMSEALTKIWAWMSTNPGVTNRPLTLIVRRASAAGNDGATALILPPAMPMSIKPRSPPAGSSTSPPASKRSYFIAPPCHLVAHGRPSACRWQSRRRPCCKIKARG